MSDKTDVESPVTLGFWSYAFFTGFGLLALSLPVAAYFLFRSWNLQAPDAAYSAIGFLYVPSLGTYLFFGVLFLLAAAALIANLRNRGAPVGKLGETAEKPSETPRRASIFQLMFLLGLFAAEFLIVRYAFPTDIHWYLRGPIFISNLSLLLTLILTSHDPDDSTNAAIYYFGLAGLMSILYLVYVFVLRHIPISVYLILQIPVFLLALLPIAFANFSVSDILFLCFVGRAKRNVMF